MVVAHSQATLRLYLTVVKKNLGVARDMDTKVECIVTVRLGGYITSLPL